MFDVKFAFDSNCTEVQVELDTTLMRQILAHAEARTEHHGRELDGLRVTHVRDADGVERNVVIGVYKHGEVAYPVDEYGLIGWPDA